MASIGPLTLPGTPKTFKINEDSELPALDSSLQKYWPACSLETSCHAMMHPFSVRWIATPSPRLHGMRSFVQVIIGFGLPKIGKSSRISAPTRQLTCRPIIDDKSMLG